ncbi:homocysteine S-methyltransferase YbgG-like isoform X2 [Rhopilema esculentum]|uniref:homocysteine S-methyltransferase YbgG-like isoform X2 n=1 Tax=Rhopilema esculentum TaxID=499914 RepID=UPI0031D4998E
MEATKSFTEDGITILDGGLATELPKIGFNIDNDPLWSARILMNSPSSIKEVHKRYLEAGSDVLITSSYQTSVPSLIKFGNCSREEALGYIKLSVTVAKDACEEFWRGNTCKEDLSGFKKALRRFPLVAGSVGPYGACQHDCSEYSGKYVDSMSLEELIEWHRPRMVALVEAGVDLLAIETIPALEALALCDLLKSFPSTKAWISFSCKDEQTLCHGEKFTEAVSSLSSFDQVFGVGINCTKPEYIEPLLRGLQKERIAEDKVKVVYPNSGESWDKGSWLESDSPKKLCHYASSWIDSGGKWIGGCCRTSPDDIRSLRESLKS